MIVDIKTNKFSFEELEVGDVFESDWQVHIKIRPVEDKNKWTLGNCVNMETGIVVLMPPERSVRLIQNCILTNKGASE